MNYQGAAIQVTDKETLLMSNQSREVLDKGRVHLVGTTYDFVDFEDYYDGEDNTEYQVIPDDLTLDSMIARAARVSYQSGTKTKRSDADLVDYLIRHDHSSPLEMIEFKFRIKAPLFVVQQLLRHRTANVNQESGRYSVLKDEFYLPEVFREQDTVNKQGSVQSTQAPDWHIKNAQHLRDSANNGYADYLNLLSQGVAREQARMVLPSNIYTNLVWKCDLRNLLHFLRLRLDSHAQQEIRDYARAMYDLILPHVPNTIRSWKNHVLNAETFSEDEIATLLNVLNASELEAVVNAFAATTKSKSRVAEFRAKLGLLNG